MVLPYVESRESLRTPRAHRTWDTPCTTLSYCKSSPVLSANEKPPELQELAVQKVIPTGSNSIVVIKSRLSTRHR